MQEVSAQGDEYCDAFRGAKVQYAANLEPHTPKIACATRCRRRALALRCGARRRLDANAPLLRGSSTSWLSMAMVKGVEACRFRV